MEQRITIERGSAVLADRARVASNPWSRMRGLLGRRDLPAGEAIVLEPASSIHTAFMAFAIDVVFVDRGKRVLKVVHDLRPFRLATARGARTVIEMKAGSLADVDIQAGDRLVLSGR